MPLSLETNSGLAHTGDTAGRPFVAHVCTTSLAPLALMVTTFSAAVIRLICQARRYVPMFRAILSYQVVCFRRHVDRGCSLLLLWSGPGACCWGYCESLQRTLSFERVTCWQETPYPFQDCVYCCSDRIRTGALGSFECFLFVLLFFSFHAVQLFPFDHSF